MWPLEEVEENRGDGYRGIDHSLQIRNSAVKTISVLPMMPKMSRMEGTKMTSTLTREMRKNAMPM